ncbi:hypothetical protein VPH35_103122 [Triticum aestivum]
MSRVSVSRREIKLRDNKVLKFYPEDFYKVFGIPCGHRSVKGRDANINPEAIHFIKSTLQMNKTGVHSLRAAKDFLMCEINENSSKLEKDCFQIAFVIFHNYTTIDFWGAIANTEPIDQFNWCEYVLEHLFDAIKNLKRDMMANNLSTNLTGRLSSFFQHLCIHMVSANVVVVLQVFLLDNLDLGIFSKSHSVLPRISEFDPESFRRMLAMAADPVKGTTSYAHANLRDASTVCYVRHKFSASAPLSATTNRPPRRSGTPTIGHLPNTTPVMHGHAGRQLHTEVLTPTSAAPGPLHFAKYLREKYPHLVADEITMILKQHNARGIMHLTQATNTIQQALLEALNGLQMDFYTFSDKVIKSVTSCCVCYRARGFTECPESALPATSKSVRFRTPAAEKIQGQRIDLSDCEATSPLPPAGTLRKRAMDVHDSMSNSKKSSSRSYGNVLNYFKSTLMSIAQMYADLPVNTPFTVFGQCCTNLHKRKYIFQHGFATDPWVNGVVPHLPHMPTTDLIVAHFTQLPTQHLQRYCIIHDSPRLICVTGTALRKHLVRMHHLHHELVSIIMRRYSQSDQETIVLADHEYLTNISIQKQLVGNEIPYDITSCHMFFLPVQSEDGWIILMWDMTSRKIHVLDPLIRDGGPSEETKDKHELIAWKLHHALFQCLNEYYAGWPTQDGQWASKYPVVAEENFDRYVLIFSPKSTGTFIIFLLAHIIFPFFPFFSMTKQTRNWRLLQTSTTYT